MIPNPARPLAPGLDNPVLSRQPPFARVGPVAGPRPTNKKTTVPTKETAVVLPSASTGRPPPAQTQTTHLRPKSREHHYPPIPRQRDGLEVCQLTPGRFSDSRPTGKTPSRPPDANSGQARSPLRATECLPDSRPPRPGRTHTAARPSRILTAFPFDYPGGAMPPGPGS